MQTRDGRQLHTERLGEGTPVVVFEAGLGGSRNSWAAVTPRVAAVTSTLTYDRSGLGLSPRHDGARNLTQLAADLVDVIGQLDDAPVILVGHSWGGPIVRSAAAQVPGRVVGLVLVDQTDEGCELFFSKANERQTKFFARATPTMARLGLLPMVTRRLAKSLPEPAATAMRTEDATVAVARTYVAEMLPTIDDLRRLRDQPPALPDVPVTVISGGKSSRMERGRRGELVAAHRSRAASLPQGRHVVAGQSSHMIPFTEPALIADEVLRIVELARR